MRTWTMVAKMDQVESDRVLNIEKYGTDWIITDLLIDFHRETKIAMQHQDIDMATNYAKAISDLTIAFNSNK